MSTLAVASRRHGEASLRKQWPHATLVDVTSKGPQPWVRCSPFYPHGGIPVPNSPGVFAQSVEGLWQGLKVFEHEDIDPRKWAITSMTGIKRSSHRRGAVLGHRFGVASHELLDYLTARIKIYLPAYRWVLDQRLQTEVQELLQLLTANPVVLLDYETNEDLHDLTRPLSHAALIRAYLEDRWPA